MKLIVGCIFFHVFLIVALLVSHQINGRNTNYVTNNYTSLFIFGDSFLDAGNNNYINTTSFDQANFLPYGETYFKFPTGRFSDGRLVSDFIGKMCNFSYFILLIIIQFGITYVNIYSLPLK